MIWVPIIITVAVITAGTAVFIVATKPKKVSGVSLGVLGDTKSGKTSFLYRLGLVKNDGQPGGGTIRDEFVNPAIIKTKKRKINVNPGLDIGGTPMLQKKYTAEYCKSNDIVIYIFDGLKFLNEKQYKEYVNRILRVIYNLFNDNSRDLKEAVIIASRADKYKDGSKQPRQEMLVNIVNSIDDEIRDIVDTNFYVMNLTSKEEVQRFAEKVFGK